MGRMRKYAVLYLQEGNINIREFKLKSKYVMKK